MKKIGISLRVENIKNYNEKRDTLSHDWIHFLQSIDLLPILIPNNLEHLENYIMKFELDGLILSGGDNIGDFPERDKTETTLLKYAMRNSIPILGVCRGMQIINHFFNGKITKNNFSNHVGTSHYVQLSNEKIINTLGSSKIKVNSFHNNLIKISDLSNELKPFAKYEDDSIEGYIHKNHIIMGVMWHPERDMENKLQKKLIQFFYNDFCRD